MQLIENVLAAKVVDICFWIHRQYGPGLYESVYDAIICYECEKHGLAYEKQAAIALVHEGLKMEVAFRADVIVERKLLLEIKSVEKLADVHFKQVQTYLKWAQTWPFDQL